MPYTPYTMMAIWLAAAMLVPLPEEFSVAEQQYGVESVPQTCAITGGFQTKQETDSAMIGIGCQCGKSTTGEHPIILPGSFALPAFTNRATVFLSGWDFEYPGTDHKVAHIEARIDNVSLAPPHDLIWTATGILRDTNFDDAFRWCYYYTVLAWDDSELTIQPLADKPTSNHILHDFHFDTATVVLPSYSRVPNLLDARSAAVLPRGFGFAWGDKEPNIHADLPDNNLLQLAYNLTPRELFIRPEAYGALPAPQLSEPVNMIEADHISWESHGILKDDERERDYFFREVSSVLNSPEDELGRPGDVRVTQPPFTRVTKPPFTTILPHEDAEGVLISCLHSSTTFFREEHEIANVAFEHAVPVLTGWNLHFDCSDEHVQRIGVWLADWEYKSPPPGSRDGRLRYTVEAVLRDKDADPGGYFFHKVDVLGIGLR